MTNMFLKRVAKLLDGLPVNGYSEARKPIRAPSRQGPPRAKVPSEFELHSQVLQNTWGRIEFEIQPLTQQQSEKPPNKSEIDYRVRVKTKYRMAVQKQQEALKEELRDYRLAQNMPGGDNKPQPPTENPVSALDNPRLTASPRAVMLQEKPASTDFKHGAAFQAEEVPVDSKVIPQKKEVVGKEFHCRESQRMLTLISQRKRSAEIMREKSVFVNFSLPVLSTLARSPQTPKSALKWLAFHENPTIRKAVARNKNTDLDILEILARDEEESIRLAVAENSAVDKEFLLKLLNDDMSMVVDKARNILDQMTRSEANQNNRATLKALSEFVDGDEISDNKNIEANDTDFLRIVASKATTPSQRLSQLAKHDDWNVRMAVAGNPNATLRTLCLLAEDPVSVVRNRVIANCNCPPKVILDTMGH